MQGKETRRSVLKKGIGVATFLTGGTALSGTAAAASDTDYIIDCEPGTGNDYVVKVPWGENDGSHGISAHSGIESGDDAFADDENREYIVDGSAEDGGSDTWETRSTAEPYVVDSKTSCNVSIYKKT